MCSRQRSANPIGAGGHKTGGELIVGDGGAFNDDEMEESRQLSEFTVGLPRDKEVVGMGKTKLQTLDWREDMARFEAGRRRDPCSAVQLRINAGGKWMRKYI
jgi:hypothetical protein